MIKYNLVNLIENSVALNVFSWESVSLSVMSLLIPTEMTLLKDRYPNVTL